MFPIFSCILSSVPEVSWISLIIAFGFYDCRLQCFLSLQPITIEERVEAVHLREDAKKRKPHGTLLSFPFTLSRFSVSFRYLRSYVLTSPADHSELVRCQLVLEGMGLGYYSADDLPAVLQCTNLVLRVGFRRHNTL